MSATARIWAALNDKVGSRCYRLPIGGLLELKERTGLTPPQLFKLLTDAPDDLVPELDLVEYSRSAMAVAHILEVALFWGGSSRQEAREIVDRWCLAPNRNLGTADYLPLAVRVLQAALSPPDDEPFPPARVPTTVDPQAQDTDVESFPFAPYYVLAGAVGLAPSELLSLSVWELAHFQKGWKEANGVEEKGLTRDEFDNLSDLIDKFGDGSNTAEATNGDGH